MSREEQLTSDLKEIAAIENAFKALGKQVYTAWKDTKKHNFETIMKQFDLKLTKLKETKK